MGGGGRGGGIAQTFNKQSNKKQKHKNNKKRKGVYTSCLNGRGARLEFKSFKLHVYITTVNTIYSYHFVKLRVVADFLNCKNVSSPLSFLLARHIIIERMFRT